MFTMTQNDAQNRLQSDGLRALGLASPRLSAQWAAGDVTYDATALTLDTGALVVAAPFSGLRVQTQELATFALSSVSGATITGPGTVLRLHPQAAQRLDTLLANVLGTAAAQVRPMPHTLVVRVATGNMADGRFDAGDAITTSGGVCSFHDDRGLIVCPVAVAALFVALSTAFPAVAVTAMANVPGGVANIANKASGVLVQVTDPHGAPFVAPAGENVVVLQGNAQVGQLGQDGLATLANGQSVGVAGNGTRVRVGFARNDTLRTTAVTMPTPSVALTREFLRVMAVDLPWHLLGNRTAGDVQGIPAADQTFPAEFQPTVRDRVNVDFMVDGVDVLGAANGVLTNFQNAGNGLVYGVSPVFDTGVGLPQPPNPGSSPDPATHWPRPPAGTPAATLAAPQLTATLTGQQDVTVSVPGGAIPVGWHVRVLPRQFVVIASIDVATPSFLRGDGAANRVADANPFSMLLRNPLRLANGASMPPNSQLVFDLVVTDPNGARRIFGNQSIPVGNTAAAPNSDPFALPDQLGLMPASARSVAPSPVFGIPGQVPPGGPPPLSIVGLMRSLTSETTPRIGPRLPTMARFPTMVIAATGNTNAVMPWSAVVTGGHWTRSTRSADLDLGNPGNPAGVDTHAPGVVIDAALAFDAATIAIRRVQPILPFDNDPVQGWMPWVGVNGWVAPADGTAPGPATCAGAVLRTVAIGAETPELTIDAIPIPPPNASVQMAINSIINQLGGAQNPNPPQPAAEGRIVKEIRREFHVARFGQRDALYSLRRAIGQARDLVMIAGPAFQATAHGDEPARPNGAPPAIDLLAALSARMAAQRSLRVVVALPRHPDFSLAYGGWVRHAFDARNSAVDELIGVDPTRIAVFHPTGFPGRWPQLPTTSVIVDDVYALVGTSHWRRRGMTFDEGVDVVAMDLTIDTTGGSARVRNYRRKLLAALTHTRVPQPVATGMPDADWVRLSTMTGCFDLVADLLGQGGLGRLVPLWRGPTDNSVLAQSNNVADPDGSRSDQYLTLLAGLIGESA